mmetsp:Transcript_23062/g.72475  ORF Transcript_23062/g.72475 Transcript_23062/m.72475 type:complete len:331 (+) Transcript_23062:520-1512(+)
MLELRRDHPLHARLRFARGAATRAVLGGVRAGGGPRQLRAERYRHTKPLRRDARPLQPRSRLGRHHLPGREQRRRLARRDAGGRGRAAKPHNLGRCALAECHLTERRHHADHNAPDRGEHDLLGAGRHQLHLLRLRRAQQARLRCRIRRGQLLSRRGVWSHHERGRRRDAHGARHPLGQGAGGGDQRVRWGRGGRSPLRQPDGLAGRARPRRGEQSATAAGQRQPRGQALVGPVGDLLGRVRRTADRDYRGLPPVRLNTAGRHLGHQHVEAARQQLPRHCGDRRAAERRARRGDGLRRMGKGGVRRHRQGVLRRHGLVADQPGQCDARPA